MLNPRRSDYDVTNTVQVSSPDAVRLAVAQLFAETWPRTPFHPVERSFVRFEEMFSGRASGYEGVDTLYHDTQHTLDISLAMARLMVGYERQNDARDRFGGERAVVGLVTALFHDVGYLRLLPPAREGVGRRARAPHPQGETDRCLSTPWPTPTPPNPRKPPPTPWTDPRPSPPPSPRPPPTGRTGRSTRVSRSS